MSTATALAAPFQEYFFEGDALNSAHDVNETLNNNVLAWSGMRYAHLSRFVYIDASVRFGGHCVLVDLAVRTRHLFWLVLCAGRYEDKGSVSMWIVVTPSIPGINTTLHLTTQGVLSTACDLVTGTAVTLSKRGGDLVYSDVLQGSVVLHIAKDAWHGPGCDKGKPLAKNLWWPQRGIP